MSNPNQPRPYNPQPADQPPMGPGRPPFGHAAPGMPGSFAMGAPAAPAKNPLGIAALVVAAIGTIFAVWEGAYIIGWILLPIAGILAIIALVQRGKQKKFAAAGLILSIIGGIAGAVAFSMSAARIIEESFGSGPVTTAPPTAGEATGGAPAEETNGETTEPAAQDGPDGTRTNPYPLGTTIAGSDWQVTVNSYAADATAEVLAANMFNEAPAAGNVYTMANVTITYTGAESGTAFEITVDCVSAGGNVIGTYDNNAVAPSPIGLDELYNGASVTGNYVFEVAAGDAGLLRVQPGLFSDEVFVAIA